LPIHKKQKFRQTQLRKKKCTNFLLCVFLLMNKTNQKHKAPIFPPSHFISLTFSATKHRKCKGFHSLPQFFSFSLYFSHILSNQTHSGKKLNIYIYIKKGGGGMEGRACNITLNTSQTTDSHSRCPSNWWVVAQNPKSNP
jgi:hypothetical protein